MMMKQQPAFVFNRGHPDNHKDPLQRMNATSATGGALATRDEALLAVFELNSLADTEFLIIVSLLTCCRGGD